MTDTMAAPTAHRRLRGIVVRASMPKTITVRVERIFLHPRVQRVVRRSRKFLAHDPRGVARIGDRVVIEETRPISRRKRWKIVKVEQQAAQERLDTEET